MGHRLRDHPRLGAHAAPAGAEREPAVPGAARADPADPRIGLLGLAAYKIAPPGIESSSIYWRWFIFLLIAAAFSLVYNLYTYKSLGAIMRPVPLEVHREAELIEEELPLPVEPGGPHLPHHDDEK